VWVLMTLALWLDRPLPDPHRDIQPLQPAESLPM
jgi:hypothetical protein